MKKVPLIATLLFSALCVAGRADTITLTSGEKLEGKILSENDAQVTINVQVTSSIADERTINRSDIQSIEKTPEDELAYVQIQRLTPDPLFAQATVVDASIAALNGFVAKYPASAHVADVKAQLAAFQKEKSRLAAGDVKLFGVWIASQDVPSRKTQIAAQDLYLKMQTQAAQNDLVAAMNTFADIEKNYNGTRAYVAAVELAGKVLASLIPQVNRSIEVVKHDADEWNKGIIITPEPQKTQAIAARKLEQDKMDAQFDEAAKLKLKWPLYQQRNQKSLEAIVDLAGKESTRIAALPVAKMKASLEDSAKAGEAVSAGDFPTAAGLLDQAKGSWAVNEEVVYFSAKVKDHADQEQKTATIAAKPTPKPKPVAAAATARPSVTPVTAAATPAVAGAESGEKPSPLAFFMTIPGALTLVVCAVGLLAIVSVVQKLKKPKDEPGEES